MNIEPMLKKEKLILACSHYRVTIFKNRVYAMA